MTRDDISKVSAESQKYCTELFDKLVNKGMCTPAGLKPTLMFPGYHGGGNWSSASFDRDQNGRPCQQPPWGTLTAVDLQKGEIAWRVPLGIVEELEAKGVHNTGTQNLGGSIVTAGGLVFIAGTTDRRFRAFDAKTGKQLWEASCY